MLRYLLSTIVAGVSFTLPLVISGCGTKDGDHYNDITRAHGAGSVDSKLSIVSVDSLMARNFSANSRGPVFDHFSSDINDNVLFESTPTGSYIARFVTGEDNSQKIEAASSKLLSAIGNNRYCEKTCISSFRDTLKTNKDKLVSELARFTTAIIQNEMRNSDEFITLYHGFPNEFRLYQDVLRTLKSFEYLKPIQSTFPLRDISFTDNRVAIDNFLKDWWSEYLKYTADNLASPFPEIGKEAAGKSVGLTYYPDSIGYARKYLLSTNINFFGNALSGANNSVLYFLNSASATKLDIVDPLIKSLLMPYVKTLDGQFDQSKFDRILAELKDIFNYYMASSGGQLAQIFIKKDIAPQVSFLAWNGGEPIWFSDKTNHVVYATNKDGNPIFRPPHIFWPMTEEHKKDYHRPDISMVLDVFISNPKSLLSYFPVIKPLIFSNAQKLLGDEASKEHIEEFVARDIQQARLLPNPKYFTDQNVTGVKIFTQNEVSPDKIAAYNEAIFQLIRGVITDFLASAQSANDFKEGEYSLKKAFLERQNGSH